MTPFIEGRDRNQAKLFPERLDKAVEAENPVRVVALGKRDLEHVSERRRSEVLLPLL